MRVAGAQRVQRRCLPRIATLNTRRGRPIFGEANASKNLCQPRAFLAPLSSGSAALWDGYPARADVRI